MPGWGGEEADAGIWQCQDGEARRLTQAYGSARSRMGEKVYPDIVRRGIYIIIYITKSLIAHKKSQSIIVSGQCVSILCVNSKLLLRII